MRQLAGLDDDAYHAVAEAASDLGVLESPVSIDMDEFKELGIESPDDVDGALHLASAIRTGIMGGLNMEQHEHYKTLAGLRGAADAIGTQMFDGNAEDDVSDLFPHYDREYNERFAIENLSNGATPFERIARKFWRPDSKNGTPLAQWYRYTFRDNPSALEDLVSAATDDLRRHVAGDPDKTEGWQAMHANSLKSFPEILTMLRDNPYEMMRMRADVSSSNIDKSQDAKLRNVLADVDMKVDMKTLPEVIARIRHDKDAMKALSRGVWSSAMGTYPTISEMEKFADDNAPVLSKVTSREHFDDLRGVFKGAREANLGGDDVSAALKKMLPMSGPELRALTVASFSSPGVAKEMRTATKRVSTKSWKRLQNYLASRGL